MPFWRNPNGSVESVEVRLIFQVGEFLQPVLSILARFRLRLGRGVSSRLLALPAFAVQPVKIFLAPLYDTVPVTGGLLDAVVVGNDAQVVGRRSVSDEVLNQTIRLLRAGSEENVDALILLLDIRTRSAPWPHRISRLPEKRRLHRCRSAVPAGANELFPVPSAQSARAAHPSHAASYNRR